MPKTYYFLTSIFQVSACILVGFGPPRCSQIGSKSFFAFTRRPFYLLKLNVFKKLHLGGLWPRFCRPRDSILEGPGSIFKGFGRLKRCLKAFLGGKHFATDLSCIIGPFAGEKWPRSCRATGRLPRMPVLPCPGSDGRGAHGVGWPAVSPPWGLSMELEPSWAILASKVVG